MILIPLQYGTSVPQYDARYALGVHYQHRMNTATEWLSGSSSHPSGPPLRWWSLAVLQSDVPIKAHYRHYSKLLSTCTGRLYRNTVACTGTAYLSTTLVIGSALSYNILSFSGLKFLSTDLLIPIYCIAARTNSRA